MSTSKESSAKSRRARPSSDTVTAIPTALTAGAASADASASMHAESERLIANDIGGYLAVHEKKSLLRFITCGSVDDGKSTLIGRLLYDSKMIYDYAKNCDSELWYGQSKTQQESLQLCRLLSVYVKQSTQLKNKMHGEEVLGTPSKDVVRSLNRQLKNIKKEIEKLESKLLINVKSEYAESLTLLKTIPGIGEKTALMMLVFTDGFNRFESSKELCSYAGITPVIRQSGSSVKGRPRISKIGNPKLRNLLFICSWNACKYNKACKALFDRLVAKGKSKKLALIAVCNKLLKQAFSIVKNRLPYDAEHRSTLA